MNPIYHAVIDAGSSGTRLFLYAAEPAAYPTISLIAEIEHSATPSGKKEDGINNFVDPGSPSKQNDVLRETIYPLLDSIRPIIRECGVSTADVRVDLLGTAGMRYAERMYGRAAIEAFYTILRQGILAAGFMPGQIRTCDGFTEEGVWTWINLNDLERDIFRTDNDPVGVLEVGGSSAQITYSNADTPPGGFVTSYVSVNNRTFPVFCNTYLGLGQDDARKAMRVNLGSKANYCFPIGFRANLDKGDSLDGVGHYKLTEEGDYKFIECNAVYEQVISELCASMRLPDLTETEVEFVATDAVYHSTKFWEAHKNPYQLTKYISEICHSVESFPGIETNEFVQAQVANATYIRALLYGNNGLFKSNPAVLSHALASRADGRTRLTWTRGYLIQAYAVNDATINPD